MIQTGVIMKKEKYPYPCVTVILFFVKIVFNIDNISIHYLKYVCSSLPLSVQNPLRINLCSTLDFSVIEMPCNITAEIASHHWIDLRMKLEHI